MNKKILLGLFTSLIAGSISAQCDPNFIDWGTATYGVSPNTALGENFVPGYINNPYSDQVYVKVPSNAGDINPAYGNFITIDSISLDSITVFNGLADVQISTVGLQVTCNNNNDSPDPCMFMPTQAYCGDISGTPTVAGTFDVKIWVTLYFVALGPQAVPYSFTGYVLDIQGPNDILAMANSDFSLSQNAPNPAGSFTSITYFLSEHSDVNLTVTNLVGETVLMKNLKGRLGENNYRLESESLETGIYLYSIQAGDKKMTRKMIVQH